LRLIAGLTAIPVVVVLLFLFIHNELQESQSAAQWGGHAFPGLVVGLVFASGFAALSGFAACRLIRFALKGPKSDHSAKL
jgi:hypothetical protein